MKELLVETANPAALDQTLQQLGGLVGQEPDGSYSVNPDGSYSVRAVGGDIGFLKFSIERQGYAKVVGEREL